MALNQKPTDAGVNGKRSDLPADRRDVVGREDRFSAGARLGHRGRVRGGHRAVELEKGQAVVLDERREAFFTLQNLADARKEDEAIARRQVEDGLDSLADETDQRTPI